MRYIVCYDIEDDRLRHRVAAILSAYGNRVQQSVFECQLSQTAFRELREQLERRCELGARDSIRIYPVCGDCSRKSLGMGNLAASRLRVAYIHL